MSLVRSRAVSLTRALLALFGGAALAGAAWPHAHAPAHTRPIRKHHPQRHRWHFVHFIVTAYVVRHDTGCTTNTDRTATNTWPTIGTVAGDPKYFPPGTRLIIPGYGYGVLRDTGSAIKHYRLDVAMLTCKAAIDWGRQRLRIAVQTPPPHQPPQRSTS